MKAVGIYKALPIDHPQALLDIELSVPIPGHLDILVKVEAVSVNPADVRARGRKADDGQPAVLGWDAAGVVVEMGVDVTSGFNVGDNVYYAGDLTRPGANAQFQAVDSRIVGRAPKTLQAFQAAAVPLTVLTAWEALFVRMGLSMAYAGRLQSLFIVGGAGGAGSMAIQLGKLVPGLRVVATASRPESTAWCYKLGADAVIDHFGDMRAQLLGLGLPSVDAILILQYPDQHFPTLADMLTPQGSMCSIVPFDQTPDINLLMRKSATFSWEFMFTRSMFNTPDISEQGHILNTVAKLLDEGRLVSTSTEVLGPINAQNLCKAHAQLETGRTIGKLTLTGF
jgi:zinc-binding alcohol dehydrogenase family protein